MDASRLKHGRLRAVREQVSCSVSNEAVVLQMQRGLYHGMNPVGSFIWEQLQQQPRTMNEIIALVTNKYEVDARKATDDVMQFLQSLHEAALIEADDAPTA